MGNKTMYYSRMQNVDMRNQIGSSRRDAGATHQRRVQDSVVKEGSPEYILRCTKL